MGSHINPRKVPIGLRQTGCQSRQSLLPARNSSEDCETGGQADFQKPTMDFSTRLRSGPQCENQSVLVQRQFTRFYQLLGMAPVVAGLKPAGLCYMGHVGGQSQRHPTPKFERAQTRRSARMEETFDGNGLFIHRIMAFQIEGLRESKWWPI